MQEKMLEIRNLTKRFPGVVAVNDVSLDVYKGEVHILMGENGAGKSTLVNMIAGILPIDGGSIVLDGKDYRPHSVLDAQKNGISMVHQELSLMDHRTVAQNLFLGREPMRGKVIRFVDHKRMNAESQKIIDGLRIPVHANDMVRNLSVALKQMVEIATANSMQNKVLILDEPTSSLTEPEIESLFDIVRQLKEKGVSIIYISHRMNEIFRIGDRVTVMRDGMYVGTRVLSETSTDSIIQMMIGRKINKLIDRTQLAVGKCILETKDLTGLAFRNVNIRVHSGEIVGLAGLVGAGRTEVGRAIFGADPIEGGELLVDGNVISPKLYSQSRAIHHGISLLPEERKTEGLFLNFSVGINIVTSVLKKLNSFGMRSDRNQRNYAEEKRKELHIATTSVNKIVSGLSGGNQQKVVLAKWIGMDSQLYIFDEPTRGIDIGAKTEIYSIMDELAQKGAAILMISSEMAELIAVADRVYVMKDGEITGELVRGRDEISENSMLSLMLGKGESKCSVEA